MGSLQPGEKTAWKALQGNPLQAVWCVKNAASSSQPFLGPTSRIREHRETGGAKRLPREALESLPLRPPTPLLELPSPPLQWAGSASRLFHSLRRGRRRGKTKILKITVSLLKKEKLSCPLPSISSPRPLPFSLLPPPHPLHGAHVCFLQHRATWFQLGAEPYRDGGNSTSVGRSARNPLQRGRPGLQHGDEGPDRGIAAHAVRRGRGRRPGCGEGRAGALAAPAGRLLRARSLSARLAATCCSV